MGEKRKWFDPAERSIPPLRPISEFQDCSHIDPQDEQRFAAWVGSRAEFQLFANLLRVPPVHRLARNLRVVIDRLANGEDGIYTHDESRLLASLSVRGLQKELQDVAYALLNTYERYQTQQATAGLFRRAHARAAARRAAEDQSVRPE